MRKLKVNLEIELNKQQAKINTSLVINRGKLKQAFLNWSDQKVDIDDQVVVKPQDKESSQLIQLIDSKQKATTINTYRQTTKKISADQTISSSVEKKGIIEKNSIPLMGTVDQALLESQSEAIKIKSK